MKITLPDFIIVGAMKAGTTGLFWTLCEEHPDINPPEVKELTFFDNHWNKNLCWYAERFKHVKTGQLTGESSPSYLVRPYALQRMKKIVPKAKIIIMLRNPVTRSFSQFKHYVKNSRRFDKFVNLTENFEEYLEKYAHPPYDKRLHWMGIGVLERSIYLPQIKEVFKYYNKKQVLIIKSEEYFKNPLKICNRVCAFLNIAPLKKLKRIRNYNKSDLKLKLKPATKEKLKKYFAPYNKKLYTYLKRNFGWENE